VSYLSQLVLVTYVPAPVVGRTLFMKSYYLRKPKQQCTTCDEPLYFKRDWFICSECKEVKCGKHIYYYVDEANKSITKNSKPYCKNCYRENYKI
jgi:hypothetical protein